MPLCTTQEWTAKNRKEGEKKEWENEGEEIHLLKKNYGVGVMEAFVLDILMSHQLMRRGCVCICVWERACSWTDKTLICRNVAQTGWMYVSRVGGGSFWQRADWCKLEPRAAVFNYRQRQGQRTGGRQDWKGKYSERVQWTTIETRTKTKGKQIEQGLSYLSIAEEWSMLTKRISEGWQRQTYWNICTWMVRGMVSEIAGGGMYK